MPWKRREQTVRINDDRHHAVTNLNIPLNRNRHHLMIPSFGIHKVVSYLFLRTTNQSHACMTLATAARVKYLFFITALSPQSSHFPYKWNVAEPRLSHSLPDIHWSPDR